jgi:hypothetical protein
MCSTWCALGVVGMYKVQQFVFVTNVANRPCRRLGIKGKSITVILLRHQILLNRRLMNAKNRSAAAI